MNRLENWFCSTRLWRRISEKQILPWLLRDASLGSHVLEIGAGAGAGTRELQRRAARVTSLEYDHRLARKLADRHRDRADVVQGCGVQDAHAVQGAGVVQSGDVVQGAGHMQDARIAPGALVIHEVHVVQGDAAMLPFASETFSAVVAVLMLHHLPSSEAQDRAFAEIARVLQPGGHFFAFDIADGWKVSLANGSIAASPC